ncbi:MAG TPA: shikimate kinase [Bryobacteraceae bacterium]|nr:shikimate kinase [Bryobacteraceae bacterium]
MLLKLKRTPGLYLVGFMGSGKSAVGRLLADELGWSFADIDEDIEQAQGLPIAEIFDTRGEEEFRRIEQETLRKRVRDVECGKPMVVALGGGAFIDPANRKLLEERGVTIWLDCPFPRICARMEGQTHRPLARDPEKFQQLYNDRKDTYSKAEHRIEADTDDPAAIVAQILQLSIF